jgi:hypothetical protein
MRVLALVAVLATATPAMADQARCTALFEAMPERLGPFELTEADSYDDPALGYYAQYDAADGSWITVFLFDGGQARVDGGLVGAYFEGAIGDIEEGHRRKGHTGARDLGRFDPGFAPVLSLGFAVTSDGPDVTGQRDRLAMGQSGDCMVKLRHTAPEGPAGQAAFGMAAKALGAVLAP